MNAPLAGPVRKRNLKLALILASVALTFFVGFVVKIALFTHG